jgi:DNA polymerase-3 subunit epsilon
VIGEAAPGAIRIALPPLLAIREATLGQGRAEAEQAVRDALAETAAAVPAAPAVYVLRDAAGAPLTVSHTADLRGRLLKADAPVVAASALEYAPCVSAFDAALRHLAWLRALEPDRYGPWLPYPPPLFLRLDLRAKFPRFEPTDVPDLAPGVRLFGPYPTRAALEQAETALYAALPLRRCTWDVQGHDVDESCIYLQMRRCAAPCTGDVPADAYGRLVEAGADLLEGRPDRAAADLAARRDAAALALAFEEAARLQAALDRLGREAPPPAFDLARWTVAVLSGIGREEGGTRVAEVAGFRGGRLVHEARIDPAVEGLEERCAALAGAIVRAPEPPPGSAGTPARARAEESALLVAWLGRARPPAAVAVDPAAPEAAGRPLAEAIRRLAAPRRRR